MKIGIDIAWLATKKIVDGIILVTSDRDFIARVKLARTEGLSVYLCPLGVSVKSELYEHADLIMKLTAADLVGEEKSRLGVPVAINV
ncbi:MAG: NYN domain-containing protein [Ignavibacteria bacterium]|nr:NYN domain-containing protein [Ignavibacteria bacterium]